MATMQFSFGMKVVLSRELLFSISTESAKVLPQVVSTLVSQRRIHMHNSLHSLSLSCGTQMFGYHAPICRGRIFAAENTSTTADMGESLAEEVLGKDLSDEDTISIYQQSEGYASEHASGLEEGSSSTEAFLRLRCNTLEPLETSTSFLFKDSLSQSGSEQVRRKGFKNRFLLLAKLGTTIKKSLELFFRSEIRQRAIVTVLILIAVRAGHFIPLPGFDRRFMPTDDLTFVSGAAEEVGDVASNMRLSLFQLGIGPFIGASIIMQVLCYIVPHLIRLRKEGSEGVKRIKQYTERLAFALAVIQALMIAFQSSPYSVYAAKSRIRYLITTTSLLSVGAVLINWLSNKITDAGFGQGPSLFICVNILTGYADSLYKVVSSLIHSGGNWGPTVLALFGFSFCFTVCAVLTSAGHRKVKLQYYNFELDPSVSSGGSLTEVEPYIPFNINPTGMQPLLATTVLMSLPSFFAKITGNSFWIMLKNALSPGSSVSNPLIYHSVTICLIFLFNILDLGNIPVEVNQYLMKIGARIPKVKPGYQTVDYLSKVQASTRFWGGLMLSVLVTTSTLVDNQFRHLHQGDSIGFTSMLIIVGAILDLRRTFLAYNVMPSLTEVLKRLETGESVFASS